MLLHSRLPVRGKGECPGARIRPADCACERFAVKISVVIPVYSGEVTLPARGVLAIGQAMWQILDTEEYARTRAQVEATDRQR